MNSKKPVTKFHSIFLFAGWALITAVLLSPVSQALAQNTSGWSYPQTIPSFDLNIFPPILVPDQYGNVHAFSTQYIDAQEGGTSRAVVYNKWNLDTGWTPPIDILLSPIQEARVTDAYLDDEGYIHLVFFGGNGNDADIYYSKAPLAEVDNARAWSKPFVIGDEAADPEEAVFAQSNRGNLIVVFHGRRYGNGLYVVSSNDKGSSWSFPIPIFISNQTAPNISLLRMTKSESGWLHAIWGVYNIQGQGRGIYYTRSEDGISWSEPSLLARAEDGLGTHSPVIFNHQDTLFAIFILPPKIVMRLSQDDGLTWSDPAIMFPRHVGVNGSISLVSDNNNTLHIFFGQRIPGTPDIHGLWHSIWKNNRWTEPEPLIKGPKNLDLQGYDGFDPYEARAVVSQGSVILVTWRTDPGTKGNGVWFSYSVVDSPQSLIIQPQVSATNSSTPDLQIQGFSTPTPLPEEKPDEDPLVEASSFWSIWILPLGVGVMVVVYLLISRYLSRKKK